MGNGLPASLALSHATFESNRYALLKGDGPVGLLFISTLEITQVVEITMRILLSILQ